MTAKKSIIILIILINLLTAYAENKVGTCQYTKNYIYQHDICDYSIIPENVIIHNSNANSDILHSKIQNAFKNAINNLNYSVYYDFNIYELSEEQKNRIKIYINEVKPSKVNISGYADTSGSTDYNLELSFKRASEIEKYIKTLQPAIETYAIGRGEINELPISRRVEIIIK